VLDSDAVIDFLAGVARSVALLEGLRERGESLYVSDAVIAEVYAGVRPKDRDGVRRVLTAFTFLPTGPADAELAGCWRHDYARRGISLSTADMLIAATAYAHQATIVTGNVKDYPMEGVTVLPLPRARR